MICSPISCWLFAAAALAAPGPAFQLKTTSGETISGALLELSASEIAIESAGGRRTAPTAKLASLTAETPPAAPAEKPSAWVALIDGSSLPALSYRVEDGQAAFETLAHEKASLPTSAIAHARFHSQSPELAAQWSEILGVEHSGDAIVIRKKEALDYQSGVAGDVNDEKVQFTLDGETLSVKRTRVEGLAYFHPRGRELSESICRLSAAGGERLEVQSAEIVDGAVRVTTPAGLKLTIALAAVASIEGKIQYLSDLTPESFAWSPFIGEADQPASLKEFHRPRWNQSLEGGALRLGGEDYAKGIAMYGGTELIYRLPPGRYRSLTALAGIDDRARPAGDARLLIYGDEKLLFEGALTGRDEPLPLEVDLAGVNRIKLKVEFGAGQEVQDHVDVCEARISK
ncbi:MAG TPA: NPCBM/NEW2 domain-containing protein [Pirellulales bacterium]|nr:NPCBM/NEW2 domain-containing protein [Pirellulales bacterium]